MRASISDQPSCSWTVLCDRRGRLGDPAHIGEIEADQDEGAEADLHEDYAGAGRSARKRKRTAFAITSARSAPPAAAAMAPPMAPPTRAPTTSRPYSPCISPRT